MADILDFDPNRELGFTPNRDLQFASGRGLDFDAWRGLDFHPGRDLGFGKKGIVFRGFVCPICDASVTEDQPSCTECGAVFDDKGRTPPKPGPARGPVAKAPAKAPPPGSAYPPPPKRPEIAYCTFCGARVSRDDSFCWNCGNRPAGPGR